MTDARILHIPGPDGSAGEVAVPEPGSTWSEQVNTVMEFLRRRTLGQYEVDDFGFDAELTDDVLLAAVRPLYRYWFRVEVRGIENIPTTGAGLVVGNHAGIIGADAAMVQVAIHDEHPAHRHLRPLAANQLFDLPFLGTLARKAGATVACNADAERLLANGELVGVWPEGYKGVGKPFSERYRLQRFGRSGFVSAALKTGAPIVPVSVIGSEEIYPMLGNMKLAARLLGLPYVPVTPTFPWLGPLGLVPLPSKWVIEFGEPIDVEGLGPAAAEDPMLVFEVTDQVRETIQHNLYRMLVRRRGIFR
ncbi:MAG: lysophospholipid acyltransferase family protein [Candidatus Nanopelagicales bacterium]